MVSAQMRGFGYDFPADPMKVIVRTSEQFEHMTRCLQESPVLFFDFETSGLAWYKHARACGLALGRISQDGETVAAWYVPFRHQTGEPQLDIERIAPALKDLLEEPRTLKVAHNFGFDEHIARREGWRLAGPRYCTLVAARIHDENRDARLKTRARTDLGDANSQVWEHHLDHQVKELSKMYRCTLKAYRDAFGYSQVPIELCGRYACFDIDYTARLWMLYERRSRLTEHYQRVMETEMALTEVLCDVEENGLPIDVEYLEGLAARCTEEMAAIESRVWRAFPQCKPFALGNDHSLLAMLEQLPGIQLTKRSRQTQQYAVDREVLEQHAVHYPALELIAEWRLFSKIATTYTGSILSRLDSHGVLHGSFRQMGTETGRMCVDKNTLIEMPRDLTKYPDGVPIHELKSGDLVHSFDWERRLCLRRVKWVGKTGVRRVVKVTARDKDDHTAQFICTPDHLVRLFRGEWKHAGSLKVGERLLTFTGRNRVVSVEHLPKKQEVWDCEIEDTHAFIGNGVTLHNSCSSPNLQNMPADSASRAKAAGGLDPFSVRRAFKNRGPGWVRIFADYSQAELRVLTKYCRDPILLDSYSKGEDVHTRTSLEVFGTADPAMRRKAKIANFGIVYGLSARGLARQANMTDEQAQQYMAKYFEKYSGVPTFKEAFVKHCAANQGFFQNIWGRPRRVGNLDSPVPYDRGKAERECFASLVQGTASELTKESMVRLHRRFKAESLPALLVNTIHDEIQIDTPIEYLQVVVPIIGQEMRNFPELHPVPVVVDGAYSTTHWSDKKPLAL